MFLNWAMEWKTKFAGRVRRALNGSALLPDVIAGIQFVNGLRKHAA